MPATPAIAPPSVIAVKTTTVPAPAASSDGFEQALRSASGASQGPAPALDTDAPAVSDRASRPEANDQTLAMTEPAAAGDVPGEEKVASTAPVDMPLPAATAPADQPAVTGKAAPSGKSGRTTKQDGRSADPQVASEAPAAPPAAPPVQPAAAAPPVQNSTPATLLATSGVAGPRAAKPAAAAPPPAVPDPGTAVVDPRAAAPGQGKVTKTASGPAADTSGTSPATTPPSTALRTPSSEVAGAAAAKDALDQAAPDIPAIAAIEPSRTTRLVPTEAATGEVSRSIVAADSKPALQPSDAPSGQVQSTDLSTILLGQAGAVSTPTASPISLDPVAAPHAQEARPVATVDQVAPALLTLAKTADGSQQMTISLQPLELGMVQVRIARAASGETHVEVTAEKAGTLLALERDQPQLHRTLDDAGVPSTGRTITFHIAQAPHEPANSNGSGPGIGQQGSTGRWSAANTDAGASGNGSGANSRSREPRGYVSSRQAGGSFGNTEVHQAATAQSYRVGLDITA